MSYQEMKKKQKDTKLPNTTCELKSMYEVEDRGDNDHQITIEAGWGITQKLSCLRS